MMHLLLTDRVAGECKKQHGNQQGKMSHTVILASRTASANP
jgi:hypothetical protein